MSAMPPTPDGRHAQDAPSTPALIEARDVFCHFGPARRRVRAVDGINLSVNPGETLGIVGESGCGKSTMAKLMLGLEKSTGGEMLVNGRSMSTLRGPAYQSYRRDVQAVFQDPYSSLNPRMKIGQAMVEPLDIHGVGTPAERRDRAGELLTRIGLPPDSLKRYPHEFSGGQRQRIAIGRALIADPKLIVLDEPISALDVSIRAQMLNLLADLRDEFGTGYVFIAHDLAAVATISDRIAVMYLGRVVEIGPADAVARSPAHPYTRMLFAAADPSGEAELPRGEPPSPIAPPPGCRFHTRCPFARDECSQSDPPLRLYKGRTVACHFAEDIDVPLTTQEST